MKCISCGGEVKFDPKTGLINCEFCGNTFDPLAYNKESTKAKISKYSASGYICSQCGAEVLVFTETAATFCSYCGSNTIVQEKLIEQEQPECIIPFSITTDEAIKIYKKKLNSFWLYPKFMKEDAVISKIRGIYMPYCIYSTAYNGQVSVFGERYAGRSGDYDIYNQYDVQSNVDACYKGISFDLLSKFYDTYSNSIAPFDIKKVVDFNQKYLAGYYVDCKDVDKSLYDQEVFDIVEKDYKKRLIESHKTFRICHCKDPYINMQLSERKLAYFPVYFLAINHKNSNKVSYAVINGQSGKCHIDYYVDYKKYIFLGIILSFICCTLIYLFLNTSVKDLIAVTMLYLYLTLIISNKKIDKIYIREKNLDDKGVYYTKYGDTFSNEEYKGLSKLKIFFLIYIIIGALFLLALNLSRIFYLIEHHNLFTFRQTGIVSFVLLLSFLLSIRTKKRKNIFDDVDESKMNLNEKMRLLWKPLIGLLIISTLSIFTPIYDEYYYCMSIVLFVFGIISFKELIVVQNKLVERKLPQFDKRGGDL